MAHCCRSGGWGNGGQRLGHQVDGQGCSFLDSVQRPGHQGDLVDARHTLHGFVDQQQVLQWCGWLKVLWLRVLNLDGCGGGVLGLSLDRGQRPALHLDEVPAGFAALSVVLDHAQFLGHVDGEGVVIGGATALAGVRRVYNKFVVNLLVVHTPHELVLVDPFAHPVAERPLRLQESMQHPCIHAQLLNASDLGHECRHQLGTGFGHHLGHRLGQGDLLLHRLRVVPQLLPRVGCVQEFLFDGNDVPQSAGVDEPLYVVVVQDSAAL